MSEGLQPRGERRTVTFRRVSLLALVAIGIAAAVFLWLRDPQQRTAFSDVISPFFDALAAASLLLAAKRAAVRSRRLALAWGTIGAAMLLYTLGDMIWTVLELFLKEVPFPSIADALYLAYYPFFLAGVVLLTKGAASPREKINKALDILTILAAAILGYWNLLLGPILASNVTAPLLEQIILLAYPVGDLVLLGALLLLLYAESDAQDLRWIHVLATGIIITIVADTFYGYASLQGTYVSGGLLDLGWIAGNLVIGLAGASQWSAMQPADPARGSQPGAAFQGKLRSITTYLPYFWLLGAFGLLIVGGLRPLPMSFLSIALGAALIMVMVLGRQLNTLSENNRLALQLKSQAARLADANQDLSAEIAERQRMAEKLSHDALHDAMTGLANRVLFMDRLGQAMERSRRHQGNSLAVLFIDVDHFKIVNDSLGHAAGDQLLILIGQRLKETVRSIDTVARFGGDEFTVLLEELNGADSAHVLTDRIQEAIRLPFGLNAHSVHVTVSIGIATDVIQYDHPEDMLRDADLALYQAKSLGKARSEVFALDMRDQAFSRLELEEELRRGVERGEFRLYYQPIRSLESDRIAGAEALVRWMHPARGLLLPADFLPVAEESGLIIPLGNWILNEACHQLKTWQQLHPHLKDMTISVNMSNREFSQPDLAAKVAGALKASGLKGSDLRLEITEQVMVGTRPTAKHVIAELQALGVQLQIDDFGVGYSALSYLQQFPIDAIKIDRSFVSQMRRDARSLGLVRAMVSMARELGMDAIAEGIETGEQLQALKALACGFGQGFLISEPIDAASLEEVLANPGLLHGPSPLTHPIPGRAGPLG
jgi:diguanylate cyclase (GGDEF)-like protein